MSDTTTPIQTGLTIYTAIDGSGIPGFATLYFQVQGADGTKPQLQIAAGQPSNVTIVQPVENPGSDPDFPVDQWPFVGVITPSVASGQTVVNLVSDPAAGNITQVFNIVILPRIPQLVTCPAAGIVITAPG